MPRLKRIKYERLYLPGPGTAADYPSLGGTFARPIRFDSIEQQYDEMVKSTVALKRGTASAEAILKRYNSNNRTHPTYKALTELGKAEKTIFLCQYLPSRETQREVQEGLNVVENWNATTDFICYGRQGELATNSREQQEIVNFQHTRALLAVKPAKVKKRLPQLLTDQELVAFYEAVWQARNPKHMIMIKLLIFTGLRNAELARVRLEDVDLDRCQISVVQGKGSRDRSVLFPASFRGELAQYIRDYRSAGQLSCLNLTGYSLTPPTAPARSLMSTLWLPAFKSGFIRICSVIRS
jgi:integrase